MTISRDDLEATARRLVGAIDETKESAKNTAMMGAFVVVAVVVVAFAIGRRRGSRNKSLIEVYKV
ncbi:MAG: hypothetical protein OEM39_06910 [Acidimicrobiia bacterium]|nr:hypothetical protein [Acidimicrobiia bacterium]MDH3463386.1 hypothetical protein [Acidimicrobiia bacterium]